jgi:hypothetical protein
MQTVKLILNSEDQHSELPTGLHIIFVWQITAPLHIRQERSSQEGAYQYYSLRLEIRNLMASSPH